MSTRKETFDRFEQATDLPRAFLTFLIVPALILEQRAQTAVLREIAAGINWIVWLAVTSSFRPPSAWPTAPSALLKYVDGRQPTSSVVSACSPAPVAARRRRFVGLG